MNYSDIAVLERKAMARISAMIAQSLVLVLFSSVGSQGLADESRYRVLLERVPGTDQLEAGNTLAGIKILEEQLNQAEQASKGDIWSTLCAAYIIRISLNQAEYACSKAVQFGPSYYALNNRGVLRVHIGDLVGAREDFERVRSLKVETELNKTMIANIRLIATNNLILLEEILPMHTSASANRSGRVRTASIEEIVD